MDKHPTLHYGPHTEENFVISLSFVNEEFHNEVCDAMRTSWANSELCKMRKGCGRFFYGGYWIIFEFKRTPDEPRQFTKEHQQFADLILAKFRKFYPLGDNGTVTGIETLIVLYNTQA